MQVVILAGGLGTRLRALTGDRPKSLIEVAGRPFIDRQLELLVAGGLRTVLVCAGYGAEQIEEHLGDGLGFGVDIDYSVEDPSHLLGTGGALVNALPQLEDEFLVLYGDSYLPTDYGRVVQAFRAGTRPAMMCVYRNEGRWDDSNVRVEGDRVVFYLKAAAAGEADYIDYGLSAYRKEVIEAAAKRPLPLDLAVLQGELVARGDMGALEVHERFYEVGKPEGVAELEAHLRKGGA